MDTMVADALVGITLDGRYRVDGRLATGGMATVYRALDMRLDRPVALKIMRAEFASDPDFVSRFQQEARAAAQLSNPNVVAVYDQGQSNGHVYLAMEYVPGRTLRDVIRAQGRLTDSQALHILEPILLGLMAAHEAGFIHRDVKPENVLVPAVGPVKVTDFGLARALQQPSNATTGVLIGTAAYLAPEQVSAGIIDQRSDVYQAGILLYEMLTGELPHTGENAWSVAYSHVNDDVPSLRASVPDSSAAIAQLVADATQRDIDQRIPSAANFLDRTRSISQHLPAPQPLSEPPPTVGHSATTVISDPSTAPDSDAASSDSDNGQSPPEVTPSSDTTHIPTGLEQIGFGANSQKDVAPEKPVKTRRKRNKRPWIVGLVVMLLAIGLTGLIAWVVAANPFDRTDVPNVVGATEAKAENRLNSVGLEPMIADRQFSETISAGTVIAADPDPGSGARVGSKVELIVSMGAERYAVPKVRGMSPTEAGAALAQANLTEGKSSKKFHDTVETGSVIRTKPKVKSSLKRATPVALIVSKGPAPVDVPNIVGISEEFAVQRLKKAGLVARTSGEDYSEEYGDGRVMRTSPSAGVEVRRGDTVSLTVSKGPPPVKVPNVVDMSRKEAESRLQALGFKVRVSEGVITPLNRVFSQDPGDGGSLPKGSTVTISVF